MSTSEHALCTKTHEYIIEENGLYKVGITDYAVEQLGDIVFIELPEVGSKFGKKEVFGTVESVKAASELYMPLGGEIVEINEELLDNPQLINDSPFEKGWIIKVKGSSPEEDLADALEYEDYIKETEE